MIMPAVSASQSECRRCGRFSVPAEALRRARGNNRYCGEQHKRAGSEGTWPSAAGRKEMAEESTEHYSVDELVEVRVMAGKRSAPTGQIEWHSITPQPVRWATMLPYVFYLIHNLLGTKNSIYSRGARGVPLCHSSNVVASVGDMCAIRCRQILWSPLSTNTSPRPSYMLIKSLGCCIITATGAVGAGIYSQYGATVYCRNRCCSVRSDTYSGTALPAYRRCRCGTHG